MLRVYIPVHLIKCTTDKKYVAEESLLDARYAYLGYICDVTHDFRPLAGT